VHDVGGERVRVDRGRGQADAVDGDRVAFADVAGQTRTQRQAQAVSGLVDRGDAAEVGDKPREQLLTTPAGARR
jgi:predicted short-subunit dehydrogenase-like oxidoreductase (DUF2520 family)